MKVFHLLATALLLLGAAVTCRAQDTTLKLHAYRQTVSPGVRPDIVADGTSPEPEVRPASYTNYYIYLTHTGSRVYPVALWIGGEPFGVKAETVPQTPVETRATGRTEGTEGEKATLVPRTEGTVLRLVPVEYIPGKDLRPSEAAIRDNELVLLYRQGGKVHTKTVKKLQALPAASLP